MGHFGETIDHNSIEFLALTVRRSVMKSIAIDPQGRLGIGRGCRSPNERCLGALDRAHVSQDLIYSRSSLFNLGHQ